MGPVNPQHGGTALYIAAQQNNIEVIGALAAAGAGLDVKCGEVRPSMLRMSHGSTRKHGH